MLINKRYLYDRELGVITDIPTSNEFNLEPRQQAVFELLIDKNKQLLKRDTIEQVVWKNYGGANDGINQAVSLLRKALNDSNRTLIKTVPKKGYMLNVQLDEKTVYPPLKTRLFSNSRRKFFYFIIIGLLVVIFYYLFNLFFENKSADEL
jgi:DNA-binding winged helix-turn-helix (wHTH) protein